MAGDLDLANIGQVMAALDRVDLDRATLVVFDLQEVVFLDSAGLQTILRLNDYCKDQGRPVKLVKPRGLASRVFTLTRVHLELDLVEPAHGLHPRKGLTRGEGVRPTSPRPKHPSHHRRLATPRPSR